MKTDHARAMPSRSAISCDHAVVSARGGTMSCKLFTTAIASALIICDKDPSTEVKSPTIKRDQQLSALS